MRKFRVRINGHVYEVEVEELAGPETSQPAAPVGPTQSQSMPRGRSTMSAPPSAAGPSKVAAPLPGVIVAVKVKPGQAVAEDEVVVVLEAMKMENELTAPRAGTVRAVLVEAGDSVDQGTVLVVLE